MLAREERMRRFLSAEPFWIIRNTPEELLRQALKIAGTIRYFTPEGEPDGYMDEVLAGMNYWLQQANFPEPDGNMEPSQAILYTFIHHMHTITGSFNKRWNEIGTWYWKEYAGIETLPVIPDNVWVKFEKNTSNPVLLEKGTGFYYEDNDEQRYIYRLQESISIENVRIAHIYSLWYERKKDIRPAGQLNYITALKYQDLTEKSGKEDLLFGDQDGFSKAVTGWTNPRRRYLFGDQDGFSKAVGIIINHPALVLKEGKRNITLFLHAENNDWINELDRVASCLSEYEEFCSREKIYFELFNNLFYLTISTDEGWSVISGSVVTREEE
ncbi:MAG: hypothetical protein LUE98_20210 [Tannerellaceae bacterium]|nr:hypothetical protein [Tannerellaceae bacterium]